MTIHSTKKYIAVLFFALMLSCKNDKYDPATLTFYPTLAAEGAEPAEGTTASTVTVNLTTSRVVAEQSQINISIEGDGGAGYGYSYTTNPPMLQPGVLTLAMPRGEATTSFEFIPKNDGLFVPSGYHYKVKINEVSGSIKTIGNGEFDLTIDETPAYSDSYDFTSCAGSSADPKGFTEAYPSVSGVMQSGIWGCSGYGYPSSASTDSCVLVNAYSGSAGASDNYLIVNKPIDASLYSKIYMSAMVELYYTGAGNLTFVYSNTYSGSGDPEATGVTWTEITDITNALPTSTVNYRVWTSVGGLVENLTGKVYFAFRFAGGKPGSSQSWYIDNLQFKGGN